MPIVVPTYLLDPVLDLLLIEDFEVCLFGNDIIPDRDTSVGDFDEIVGGGYTRKLLPANDWVKNDGIATQDMIQWDFNSTIDAPGTIYGYYVINMAGNLRWSERFPGGFTPYLPEDGGRIQLFPRFQVI